MGTLGPVEDMFRAETNLALAHRRDTRIAERRQALEAALSRVAKLDRLDQLIVEVDDLLKVSGYSAHDQREALRGLRDLRDREIARPVWLPHTVEPHRDGEAG